MSPNPSVSLIICTRNRAESLRLTIECIQRVDIPRSWIVELIVVDNGSTDGTKAVVDAATRSALRTRCVYESRTGKGYAYNCGIATAEGSILLFTDDDVRVPRNWLEGMCGPIVNGLADAVQGGIRIASHLERPWLDGALRVWVAAVENPSMPPEGLVGANMAFTRAAAELVGGFDPRLGPGASGFYDDTVFGWALGRAGCRIAYRPEVAVDHHFSSDRLKFSSFVRTAHRMAASVAVVKTQILSEGYQRPTIWQLLPSLPGFGTRCVTQAVRLVWNQRPDAGFLLRYYEICLWYNLRRTQSIA